MEEKLTENNNVIFETMDEFYEKMPKIYSEKDLNLLKMRLEGRSNKEISNLLNLQYTNVLSDIKKIVRELPEISEAEQFSELYTNYYVTKDQFLTYCINDGRVYEILSLKYKKGLTKFPTKKFTKKLNVQCENNSVIFETMDAFYEKMPKIYSEKDLNLLKMRLDGHSNKEISNLLNLQYTNILSGIRKLVRELPKIIEVDQFVELYTNYYITKDQFLTYCVNDGRVYEILSLKYKKGLTKFPTREFKKESNEEFENNHKLIDIIQSEHLEDVLEQKIKNIEFLKYRLDGLSLQEIGDKYSISRERVRQILQKLLFKLPPIIEEEKFSDIYSSFDIPEDIFTLVFHEDSRVYNFLDLKYKKGSVDILDELARGDYSEEVKRIIEPLYLKKYMNREQLLIHTLSKYSETQQYFTLDDMFYLYNSEAEELNLPKLKVNNSLSLMNNAERYKNVIYSNGKGYRYYSVDIDDDKIAKIKEIFTDIEFGCYHMDLIFKNHLELMKELEIYSGSELHNLCKTYELVIPDIILRRNPEFTKGDIDKVTFIKQQIAIRNGISITNFTKEIYNEFGLQENSLSSFISKNLPDVLINGQLYIGDEERISKLSGLKEKLLDNIYLVSDFEKILARHTEYDIGITSDFLYNLGFYQRGDFIIRSDFRGVKAILEEEIKTRRILDLSELPPTLVYALNQNPMIIPYMESEYKILKIAEKKYLNLTFIKNRDFFVRNFKNFIRNVESFVSENHYFTLESIIKDGFHDGLIDDGFSIISLERLLVNSKLISIVYSATNRSMLKKAILFYKSDDKKTLDDFFQDLLLEYGSCNVEDFIADIEQQYGIEFYEADVIERLINVGAVYSKTLNKLYVDKAEYLNEVYK